MGCAYFAIVIVGGIAIALWALWGGLLSLFTGGACSAVAVWLIIVLVPFSGGKGKGFRV